MVNQNYMEVHEFDKLNQLCNILKEKKKTIVFCAAKIRAKKLAYDLHRRGFDVVAIHGNMEQPQRTRVINEFKSGKSDILIATDVVARGIDVPTIERVISYDVPRETLVYFHRIRKTARAGAGGNAIIFVSRNFAKEFDTICRETKMQINKKCRSTGWKSIAFASILSCAARKKESSGRIADSEEEDSTGEMNTEISGAVALMATDMVDIAGTRLKVKHKELI